MNIIDESKGLLFDDGLLNEIRSKFCRIDVDADGTKRLFFENSGGSLRLKAAVTISDELNQYPDCYARDHKSSLTLQRYEAEGRADVRTLFNAKDGTIATALTSSSLMFQIVEAIVANCKGANIVTTVLEHPSAYDACKYCAEKYSKELRVAESDQRTGGISNEAVLKLIDKDTMLLNIIAASNMTGAIIDLKTIITEARKINPDIYVVSDAVQHAAHCVMDVDSLKIDAMTYAPYKFFGNRGIAFAYLSDRVKDLPHHRILDDDADLWELGSIVPAHYGAASEVINYVAWIGSKFTSDTDKRARVVEGLHRIHLQERALLYRLLHGSETAPGLLDMVGVDTFFDYSDLTQRDLILAMQLTNLNHFDTVREYEKRGIIVFERVASSVYSKRIVESFGLDGIIRVSPLHCNTVDEIDQFLRVTQEILAIRR